ncbi:GPI mannosyltransferase [Piptocephalis cylindrospora]|uniref:Mannosyltransferase n=1 Tax=Piptocephalis cylindrospora TaxID=1907219 RepID=A0A4P9Y5J8_9FUNG|nr:GPI mannosyltransferase [Piptocephalis cylindrospora]|eukprot:RKP14094.1 GPI mannosyltransferase [Piptocephalis cylindrospora]
MGPPITFLWEHRRSLYMAALITRVVFALAGSGYMHPDEYFQGPEVLAEDVLGLKAFRAWEFNPEFPCRPILIPSLLYGVPLYLLRAVYALGSSLPLVSTVLPAGGIPSPWAIFFTERMSSLLLSFTLDLSLASLLREPDSRWIGLILLSTSFPALTFLVRPFSNAQEASILAGALALLCQLQRSLSHSRKITSSSGIILSPASVPLKTSLAFGALLGLGMFCRITFTAFAFPLGLGWLWIMTSHYRRSSIDLLSLLHLTSATIGGIFSVSLLAVLADSLYYGSLVVEVVQGGGKEGWGTTVQPVNLSMVVSLLPSLFTSFLSWIFPSSLLESLPFISSSPGHVQVRGHAVLTPLNNLLYNMNVDNLSHHGLHPRWLHILVNAPLLLGPLSYMALRSLVRVRSRHLLRASLIPLIASGSSLFGLFFLSLAPHQEARFLLPALVPTIFALVNGRSADRAPLQRFSLGFWALWLTYGLALSTLFGWAHQGGIARTAMWMGDQWRSAPSENEYTTGPPNGSLTLIFWKGYMPPRHLTGIPRGTSAVEIIDAGSKSGKEIISTLQDLRIKGLCNFEPNETKDDKGTTGIG